MPTQGSNIVSASQKPNLPKRLFWDTNYDKIDWEAAYKSIIARVLERGNEEEWEEMIRFYGIDRVLHVLKNELTYLPDYAVDDVSSYFKLQKEELACYTHKQLRPGHWI